MGLFGLLATAIGLGAMASDSIKDSVSYDKEYAKAVKEGKDTFAVRGYKVYSTKTGNPCTSVCGSDNHIYYKDLKTGQIIEDATAKGFAEKTEKCKKESEKKGWKFYKTYEFCDRINNISDIWINDEMPGKYFKNYSTGSGWICGFKILNIEYFVEVELKTYKTTKEPGNRKNKLEYYPDGTIRTGKEDTRMRTQYTYEQAIEKGWKFFYDFDEYVPINIKTFKPYYYNAKYGYYVRAIADEFDWGEKEDGTRWIKRFYKEDPTGNKYNVDGTRWKRKW